MKKISVIMGIYNCASTLPDAIQSILNQTCQNWQLILCDDCSTDDTYQLAKKYADQYPKKIILLKNPTNMRLAYSLNHCLEYADGEYIARMDGDDISRPDRLEKQLRFLEAHKDIDLVGTAMQRFNENGLQDIVKSYQRPDRFSLRTDVPFCHATIMAHKYVYDKLHGYTVCERTKRGQDYDLWFRFFHAGFKGENLQEALYLVREDKDAIRRRTFKTRYEAFQTTVYGFNLLQYPKWWIIEAFIIMLIKSLAPYFIVDLYRKYQAKRR